MSTDPERLLSAHGGLDPQERELLTSLRHAAPPAGAQDEAWRGVAAQLALGAGLSMAAATAAPTTVAAKSGIGALLTSALASKVAIGATAAACVAYGGYVTSQHAFAPARQPAAHSAQAHVHEKHRTEPSVAHPPPTAAPIAPPTLVTEAPAATEKPSTRHTRAATSVDRLRIESTLLGEARAQLRAGHAAAAQQILTRLQAEQPNGALLQEREILGIDVQLARGNRQTAQQRARAFVKAHPNSPHAAKLGRLLADP